MRAGAPYTLFSAAERAPLRKWSGGLHRYLHLRGSHFHAVKQGGTAKERHFVLGDELAHTFF